MSEIKKPRLCEILGVEVGERFGVVGTCVEFFINEEGIPLVYVSDDKDGFETGSNSIYEAVNNPDLIIRKSSLTEPELAICRAMGAKWISMDDFQQTCLVDLWEHEPHIGEYSKEYVPSGEDECELGSINHDLFPSVKPGDCICVEGMYGKVGDR